MSRRWLLSLLCLSAFFLSLVELTRARGEFKINETSTRILLDKQPAEVVLAVENSTGEALNASVELETLDPRNNSTAKTSQIQPIGTGSQKLKLTLPLNYAKLDDRQRKELLWHRLRYRISENGPSGNTLAQGIVSLSEITPDLFDIWVTTSGLAREGGRYHARVQALHPITRRPAANVRIDGELTVEANNDNNTKLSASKTTDSGGYALLEFVLPGRFPQFPHELRPTGGELKVVGRRGAIVATTEGDALVDQFARILVSTDKPLYQPGQVIHLRALVFTPSRHALANQNAVFKIYDPEDTVVFSSIAKTTRFGVANADWSIPENMRLGDYRVMVAIDGGEDSSQTSLDVRISRYDLPNFTVDVETDRTYYLPGQNAEVKVRADYLFGQPVSRGHVRVVREDERSWNYREQKWEIEEGETFEGETDAKGVFTAHINLASDHEKISDYDRFRDSTYAAYFTDPTTNRTEQRRFDLRVTRDAIHVYIIQNDEWVVSKVLPMRFFVSTFYADGSPAPCNVNVLLTDQLSNKPANIKRSLATVRTNRYGLAKVSGVPVPTEFQDESNMHLLFSAVDSKGLQGSHDEEFRFDRSEMVRVETDKALYRIGEPITAVITSSIPEQTVMVDVLRESSVIRSQSVNLHKGRGSVVFPYRPEFNDKVTIAAYGDFPKWGNNLGLQTILYPRDPELKVNVSTSQASYRPGEDASVNLSVRSPEGGVAESALGVVVFDKAVEERFRTAQEFGSRYPGFNNSLMRFLNLDDQVAGVSLRDLLRLDMSRPISPEMDLLANVLLTQSRGYYSTNFYGGDEYEYEQDRIFGNLVKQQLKPMRDALNAHYGKTLKYPTDEQSLHRLLSELKIDFNSLRDPWGMPFRPAFSVVQDSDELTLISAGADKRFDSPDDFQADQLDWPYFRLRGEAIDRAVNKYYERTGRFVRDSAALREALSNDGLSVDELQDRWGKPYRFEFDVNGSNYVIKIRSGGADTQFSTANNYSYDDFIVWTSSIDYFEKARLAINLTLTENSQTTNRFPETEQEFRAMLKGSLDSLRDPWHHPYYVTFKTESFPFDRVRMEQAGLSEIETQRTVTPVTQTVRLISLRSNGVDGKHETGDDFSVAVFTGVISEVFRGQSEPQAVARTIAFMGTRGAIQGVVTDPMGAVIANVNVTAKQPLDSQTYRTTSNENGKYSLINLTPGLYELRFDAPGFKIAVFTHVLVQAYNITEINVRLEPGAVTETVSIVAEAEPLQTDFSVNASRSSHRKRDVVAVTKPGGPQLSTPRLREYFPETLLWQPSIETDKQGRAQINFKLADNITTWKMVAVGSTEDGQIGMAEKEIKAFQPFFLDHDPPRFLTDGDQISLPVTVRNYLERPQKVDLDIKSENWFSVIGPMRKLINVAAGDATRETFDLQAIATIKDGKQRITAIGSDESDSIEKPVTVRPDGEEMSVTAGDIMTDRSVLELNLPQSMIPNSMRAELKIYPNLMTHVIESVEGIMRRPYGCAEQTISSTYPSLLLLTHYKKSGGDFPLRARAQRYLNEGYSRLLGYRHESGGFTYWGEGPPDLALTAYALRFLTTASEVISVDPEVIKGAREWLLKQQNADGSWGLNQYDVMVTAYITRVLAQTSRDATDALKQAVVYLTRKASESNDGYVLAAYTLAAIEIGDTQRAKAAIEKLRLLTRMDGPAIYWSPQMPTPFHGWGLAGQVETTALVIQALTRYCDSQSADCELYKRMTNLALFYMLKKKDRYGVWYSTQATINALDAMLMLFRKQSSPVQASSAETNLFVNGRVAQTIQMPITDRFNNPITIDITQFLTVGNNRLEFKRPGGLPLASVQAVATFFVPWSDETARNNGRNGLRLNVKFDKTKATINEEITCNVETERMGAGGNGMLLAEIGLPPGADVDRSSLQAAMNASDAINQYDILPDRVVVYIWPQQQGVRFNFKFRPRLGMNAKTAPSTIYDYYNPDARAIVAPATFKVR